INEPIEHRSQEYLQLETLKKIEKCFKNVNTAEAKIAVTGRSFVKNGFLTKHGRKKLEKYLFILCNDCLLYCRVGADDLASNYNSSNDVDTPHEGDQDGHESHNSHNEDEHEVHANTTDVNNATTTTPTTTATNAGNKKTASPANAKKGHVIHDSDSDTMSDRKSYRQYLKKKHKHKKNRAKEQDNSSL
ncbi:hypothetical protein RFI_19153, partial [Reticulomyxa filosa]